MKVGYSFIIPRAYLCYQLSVERFVMDIRAVVYELGEIAGGTSVTQDASQPALELAGCW